MKNVLKKLVKSATQVLKVCYVKKLIETVEHIGNGNLLLKKGLIKGFDSSFSKLSEKIEVVNMNDRTLVPKWIDNEYELVTNVDVREKTTKLLSNSKVVYMNTTYYMYLNKHINDLKLYIKTTVDMVIIESNNNVVGVVLPIRKAGDEVLKGNCIIPNLNIKIDRRLQTLDVHDAKSLSSENKEILKDLGFKYYPSQNVYYRSYKKDILTKLNLTISNSSFEDEKTLDQLKIELDKKEELKRQKEENKINDLTAAEVEENKNNMEVEQMILYKSSFTGLKEVAEEQKNKITNNIKNGCTTMRGEELQKYIDSKFIIIDTTDKESLYNALNMLGIEYQEESKKSKQNFDKLLNNKVLVDKIYNMIKGLEVAATQEIKENNKNMEVENMENYLLNKDTGVICKDGTSENDIVCNCELLEVDGGFKLVGTSIEGTKIDCFLDAEEYFSGYEFNIKNTCINISDNTINEDKENNIINIVKSILNDKDIIYTIDKKYDNVYDLLENTDIEHKKHTDIHNLLYEFEIMYIGEYKEEFRQFNDLLLTFDDEVNNYFELNVYPILKSIPIDNIQIKEEFYNNNEVVAAPEESIILDSNDSENNSNINMSLQLLALPNKELRPIFNTDIEGHEEYQKENLNLYNSNSLAFEKKRITNKMIEEYTKYFIYKDNRFMSVKPCKNIPYGYIEHVKNNRTLSVDTKNKIILCVEN